MLRPEVHILCICLIRVSHSWFPCCYILGLSILISAVFLSCPHLSINTVTHLHCWPIILLLSLFEYAVLYVYAAVTRIPLTSTPPPRLHQLHQPTGLSRSVSLNHCSGQTPLHYKSPWRVQVSKALSRLYHPTSSVNNKGWSVLIELAMLYTEK